VTRLVTFTPERTGTHQIVVQGLTKKLDKDSVRVGSNSDVRILNVSVESSYIVPEADTKESQDGVVKLKAELEEALNQRTKVVQVSQPQREPIYSQPPMETSRKGVLNP
jgi:hypothetical protein